MNKCLCEDKLLNNGDETIKIKINENDFLLAVKLIGDDILKKYNPNEIVLLGIARGALPLLTAISHYINSRDVAIIQVKMTNTDKRKDYGVTEVVGEMLKKENTKYILLEDIVSYGRSSKAAVKYIESRESQVLEIYSIVMNNKFNEIKFNNKIQNNYVYLINDKQWVYFFWENGYSDRSIEF